MKPYFGLGANSALEDVVKLGASLDAQAAAGVTGVEGAGVQVIDRQTDRQTDRQADRQTYIQTGRQAGR